MENIFLVLNSLQITKPAAIVLVISLILAIILKGYSLWMASKRDEKAWFVAILILNTIGVLELIYLIFVIKVFSKPQPVISNENNNG